MIGGVLASVALLVMVVGSVLLALRWRLVPVPSRFLAPGETQASWGWAFLLLCAITAPVVMAVRGIANARGEGELSRERAALCDAARAAFAREPPESSRTAAIRIRQAAASVGDSVEPLPQTVEPGLFLFAVADDRGRHLTILVWERDRGLFPC